MRRLLLAVLAAAMLLLPASVDASSDLRLRGVVTDKDRDERVVTVASSRQEHFLRVPGRNSFAGIRVGQRVELRGTTLRARGNGSRVLARGVRIVGSERLGRDRRLDDDEPDDDEREVRGRIRSLSPLTVSGLTCVVPNPRSLAGFRVGDFVEMTCDLIRGEWTLRKLESEDDDERVEEDEDRDDDHEDDNSGSGRGGSGGGPGHG